MFEFMLGATGGGSGPTGQKTYTGTEISETFVVPSGVKEINCLCVGCGYAGGGGLSWRNSIPVQPDQRIQITINRTESSIKDYITGEIICISYAGTLSAGGKGSKDANIINDGGGNGGDPYKYYERGWYYIGGGAGGYTGNGGTATSQWGTDGGMPGTGGGGGSGAVSSGSFYNAGGVGILGQGTDGAVSTAGSGGTSTKYGGGSTGSDQRYSEGAIRILWGQGRAYPSTKTGNL